MIMRDFLFRKNFFEFYSSVRDSCIGLAFLDCLCEYGATGKCDFERYKEKKAYQLSDGEINCMKMMIQSFLESIDKTDERHQKAVINGRNGGLKGGKLGGRGNKKNVDGMTEI
jgi:hypothetical protein